MVIFNAIPVAAAKVRAFLDLAIQSLRDNPAIQ
jgi:hypothetical protein